MRLSENIDDDDDEDQKKKILIFFHFLGFIGYLDF